MARAGEENHKDLGLVELVAIALGGMIGGGIFSILGVAVEELGNAAPIAIAVGALLALLAASSYARLAAYFEDEGATYSFFKRTYPTSHFAAAAIGWVVVFGYISTLALYSFTFSSYVVSLFATSHVSHVWLLRSLFSAAVLSLFAFLNIVSVKKMGHVEDAMVYSKLLALILITVVLYAIGSPGHAMPVWASENTIGSIFVVASLTFVAFEGFQLAIHAYREVSDARRNVPRAIYISIGAATLIYVSLAEGALWALDKQQIIDDKEYALVAGARTVLGPLGHALVMGAALLATSSAISGTLFGASRLMAVIAEDGYFPKVFAQRVREHTPAKAIIVLAVLAWMIGLSGGLELILEFGSLTFIVVSLLMAIANFKLREHTGTSLWFGIVSVLALAVAACLILLWQMRTGPLHLAITVTVGGGVVLPAAGGCQIFCV